MVDSVDDLPRAQRDAVRGLLNGTAVEDLAWSMEASPKEVLDLADQGLGALEPRLAGELEAADRRRVGAYLLGRQSPGQAAGTWELLERSAEARQWATRVRECLAGFYDEAPPSLPGLDDAQPPTWRLSGGTRNGDPGRIAARRAARARKRQAEAIQAAVHQEVSPFRQEAMEDYQQGQDRVKLPHYASRAARLALVALAVLFVAALVFCALVEVPVYTEAKVLVASLDESAPGPQQGVSIVALFPTDVRDELETGATVRVELPDTEERVGMDLSFVEDDVLSPQEIIDRYGIPDPQSRRVRDPAAVAVADLEVPDGAPARSSFEGVVTEQANLRTGTQRIISLLF